MKDTRTPQKAAEQTTFDYICLAVFFAVIFTTPFWLRWIAPFIIGMGA